MAHRLSLRLVRSATLLILAATTPALAAAATSPTSGSRWKGRDLAHTESRAGPFQVRRPDGPVVSPATPPAPGLEDLVFVTEDTALVPGPVFPIASPAPDGCDAISVLQLGVPDPLYRGKLMVSPGRLAASHDFSRLFAVNSNINSFDLPFVYVLQRRGEDPADWYAVQLRGAGFALLGSSLLLPDDETFLVSIANVRALPLGSGPPYFLRRYQLPEVLRRKGPAIQSVRVGSPLASTRLPGTAIEMFLAADGRTVHLLTDDMQVLTLDSLTLAQLAPPIALAPFMAPPPRGLQARNYGHATMTADGRYLITNRGSVPELNVADLQERRRSGDQPRLAEPRPAGPPRPQLRGRLPLRPPRPATGNRPPLGAAGPRR